MPKIAAVVFPLILTTLGCFSSEEPRPVFELRHLTHRATQHSSGTSYSYEATVVASGDDSVRRRPYEVLFAVKRLDGGDPDHPRDNPEYVTVYVVDGIGKFSTSAGSRSTPPAGSPPPPPWEPEKIEVRAIGYREFATLPPPAATD